MSPLLDWVSAGVGGLFMLAAPGYLVLQVWAPRRLTGRWRTASLAPLAPAVGVFLWCAYALADQSGLWPIPFLMFAPPAAAYLALVLAIGRKAAPA